MKVFSLIFVAVPFLVSSDAHPGDLNANGGHYKQNGKFNNIF